VLRVFMYVTITPDSLSALRDPPQLKKFMSPPKKPVI
jgi:hypothetical protein